MNKTKFNLPNDKIATAKHQRIRSILEDLKLQNIVHSFTEHLREKGNPMKITPLKLKIFWMMISIRREVTITATCIMNKLSTCVRTTALKHINISHFWPLLWRKESTNPSQPSRHYFAFTFAPIPPSSILINSPNHHWYWSDNDLHRLEYQSIFICHKTWRWEHSDKKNSIPSSMPNRSLSESLYGQRR